MHGCIIIKHLSWMLVFLILLFNFDGSSAIGELENDREKLLTAVKQDGYALGYASQVLKGDKEVVLAAVKQDGCALQYTSQVLKGDKEFMLAAVQENAMRLNLPVKD